MTRTEAELGRLAAAVAEGGALATLVGAIQAREAKRDRLRHEIRALDAQLGGRPANRKAIEARLRAYLADWRGLLHRCVGEARQMLEALLTDRLVFTPTTDADGVPCYRVRGTVRAGANSQRRDPFTRWYVPSGIRHLWDAGDPKDPRRLGNAGCHQSGRWNANLAVSSRTCRAAEARTIPGTRAVLFSPRVQLRTPGLVQRFAQLSGE